MTSNVGSNLNTNSIGFNNNETAINNKVLDSLKETFRPEFLNRIDEIVSFKALTKTELLQIVDLMLQNTNKALQDKDIIMNISDSAKNFLLEKGTDLKYGARPLRRAIQRYVEDELSDLILKSDLKNGQTVNIDCINNELSFVVE
jgi:ATP-dependent Clp protease ATP-binding subunit ClpE